MKHESSAQCWCKPTLELVERMGEPGMLYIHNDPRYPHCTPAFHDAVARAKASLRESGDTGSIMPQD